MSDEKNDQDAGIDEELPPEPPKSKSVLMDILDRARDDTEAETAKLMSSLKAKEDEEKRRRLEEENKKAEESRKRVEEERRKREAALKEYELRKAREAEEERMRVEMAKESNPQAQPEKSRTPMYAVAAVLALVVVGAGIWFLAPRGEPVVFRLDRPLATAKPGVMSNKPVPFGPASVAPPVGEVVPPDKLVMMVRPRKYEPPAPRPKTNTHKKGGKGKKAKPRIKINTGILGGRKVIK
ncbi:MAG: hypothetical protein GXP54_05295 [Deltaproteobacteria bacterium]|nr:hypothetical protein [Deltaproteobacteria bacterium]